MRVIVLWVLAVAVMAWYYFTDPNGGAETIARVQYLAWIFVASGPVYLLRRALLDGARSRDAFEVAMSSPTGAGLAFLGMSILTAVLFLSFSVRAGAAEMPLGAQKYLPVLAAEQAEKWPDMPLRSALAAQVEQETCPTLRSAKCWSPRAELKTAREYGFGLGQITVTKRFDNFAEARKLDPSLRDWAFTDRYDATRQLRTLVLMDRDLYRRLAPLVKDGHEALAMSFAAYNGGLGGVLADRRLCARVKNCDPQRWWGNVEHTSLKAKTVVAGYGKSFFAINREYVKNIMHVRRGHYAEWFGDA
ncbi:MAG: hypothetical protein JNM98_18585 [Rhodocyclaceae bacterium]|nr:hypothetical protein [Rhodocyclaceae bacterium]